MPAPQSNQLVDAILDAIQESGYTGLLISAPRRQPGKFVIAAPEGTEIHPWVYAWTLTHGGGSKRPEHEYRIQMTSVNSPLEINPLGPTVLLGYEPDRKVFAGFDISRHRIFAGRSPSVQVDIRSVDQALQEGFAFDRKANDEIAVSFRPAQFMAYVENSMALHKHGSHAETFKLLAKASARHVIPEQDFSKLNVHRRRIVQTVSRLSRQANFRQQVLFAYGNRCAISRLQLRLVDAAHILPVGAPGSVDDVRNGIALSPTYHRAYDNGLIFLDEEYRMRVNPEKGSALSKLNLDGGLQQFKASLGKILLPPDRRQWPHSGFIKKANRFRMIEYD